ncbi:Hypothetical_protein [Hexamita inflata]|uniref:Hypothetical_protein n=1 Tax=Hexamita inflata TaxID=28002 RepID=A0AA86Q7V6_9EUKA|nr:Hypothetical protein HINF_LOCUS38667 [Hexamita inflata]CAI9958329.1 Hypothetical protein HINF_LOCUS45974 [Hexamita inflata]
MKDYADNITYTHWQLSYQYIQTQVSNYATIVDNVEEYRLPAPHSTTSHPCWEPVSGQKVSSKRFQDLAYFLSEFAFIRGRSGTLFHVYTLCAETQQNSIETGREALCHKFSQNSFIPLGCAPWPCTFRCASSGSCWYSGEEAPGTGSETDLFINEQYYII